MITTETPYKLVQIIHDTWTQIYRSIKLNNKKRILNPINMFNS